MHLSDEDFIAWLAQERQDFEEGVDRRVQEYRRIQEYRLRRDRLL